jgi:circadian clock protein KaiC
MPEQDLVRTGIKGLDPILSGGIPRGNLILVEGAAGTGKTTLGVEFVYRGAQEFGEPGLIVLFEVSPDRMMREAALFGWNLRELELQGRIKILFTTRRVFEQELQQADSLLLEEAREIGARRFFVDSFAPAGLRSENGRPLRESFHLLAEGLQREGLTAMIAAEVPAHEETRLAADIAEEFVADTIVLLRMERMDRAIVRSIELVKSRGHGYQMGAHTFRITNDRGIEVYRRVQAPREPGRERAAAYDVSRRLASGIEGLDQLLGGGFWPGATTLVCGVSGVGKSVMALQYLAEGARRGDRGLMVTLDEPPAQVIRNASTIGIDLQSFIDQGLIELWYDSPQEMEIDRHFARLEELVQTHRPKRSVIDSLSTYGSNLGQSSKIFRDFLHACVGLMKEYQVTAVYNHENPEMLGMTSMMGDMTVSSLVDTIILMNWVELGDTFRLGLTVAKMRASPIVRRTHECEIVDGRGLRVLPRAIEGSVPALPFAAYYGLVARSPERHAPPLDRGAPVTELRGRAADAP